MKLRGRAAVLTGAAGGIGQEIARLFRREGARVLVTYLSSEAEARALSREGIDIMRADVTSVRDVGKIVETARARFGRLDILVNLASATIPKCYKLDITEIRPGDFDQVYKVDCMGTFLCCREAMPLLRRARGSILNFSSAAALEGDPTALVYAAAKAAIDGFTRALARQAAPEVRVNAIAPGSIGAGAWIKGWRLTPADLKEFASEVPMKRLGTPSEIASAALFLVSDDAAFVTGHTLFADGGGCFR